MLEIQSLLNDGIEEINTGPILRMKKVTKEATKEMSEYAKEAARNMQDAFADFLFDPFEDGLKGMLKSFLDTMKRMWANKIAASLFDSRLYESPDRARNGWPGVCRYAVHGGRKGAGVVCSWRLGFYRTEQQAGRWGDDKLQHRRTRY